MYVYHCRRISSCWCVFDHCNLTLGPTWADCSDLIIFSSFWYSLIFIFMAHAFSIIILFSSWLTVTYYFFTYVIDFIVGKTISIVEWIIVRTTFHSLSPLFRIRLLCIGDPGILWHWQSQFTWIFKPHHVPQHLWCSSFLHSLLRNSKMEVKV